MAPKEKESSDRITMSELAEQYQDYLEVDAITNRRSKAEQARTLLYAKLRERKKEIDEKVAYLAKKRRISPEEMFDQILTGQYQRITSEEYAQLLGRFKEAEELEDESVQ